MLRFNDCKRVLMSILFIFSVLFQAIAGGQQDLPVFAYQDRVGDAAAILAAEAMETAGLFEAKRFSSGGLCAEALINGVADLATMGDAVLVKVAARFPDKIIILGSHGRGAGRHRMVSIQDNPGTIAVKFGTSTHAALIDWLNERKDVLLIDMSPDLQISALAAGEVDALAASEPTPSIAAHRISGTRTVSLEMPGRSYPLFLVTTKRAMSMYPQQIEKLKSELAVMNIASDQNRAYLSDITGLQKNLLVESLKYHEFGFHSIEGYAQELQELSSFLYDIGVIPEIPDWKKHYTN